MTRGRILPLIALGVFTADIVLVVVKLL